MIAFVVHVKVFFLSKSVKGEAIIAKLRTNRL